MMDDLISRQAAIEYLVTNMNWVDEEGEQAEYDEKVSAITDLINGVPSADSEDAVVDSVLEIIDKHGEQLVHSIVDGSYPEIKAADILASVREDVSALKGGEQE